MAAGSRGSHDPGMTVLSSTDHVFAAAARPRRSRVAASLAFGRHLAEMLVAMLLGMTVLGVVDGALLRSVGLGGVRDLPLADLALMAAEMTVPMTLWMVYRRHRRRDVVEMAGAMLIPAALLVTLGIATPIAPMTAEMAYHPAMILAMVGLMAARRDVYAQHHGQHGTGGAGQGPLSPSSLVEQESSTMSHTTSVSSSVARFGAAAALVGLAVEIAASVAHPSTVQPNDSARVYVEYARASAWIPIHLGQLAGALLVGLALVIVAASMRRDRRAASAFAVVGAVAGLIAMAVFTVQMAVDGLALKAGFDAWTAAVDPAARASAFTTTEVVRALEKGLDGIFGITNGVALVSTGLAILLGRRYSLGLGTVAVVAGVGLTITGWLTALTGFSPEAAAVAGPTQVALLLFLVGSAVALARASRTTGAAAARPASVQPVEAGAAA
jgi:hypothetical protein